MYSIDEVHRLLEEIDDTIQVLSEEKRESVDVTEAGNLCLIIGDIIGWDSAYSDMPARIGISASVLSKFVRLRGRVRVTEARKIADRLRSYLRSFDQRSTSPVSTAIPLPTTESQAQATRPPASLAFRATQWSAPPSSPGLSGQIKAIARLLENVIRQATATNLPPEDRILPDIERNQLIALLETTINVLKSPLFEKGLIERARTSLQRAAGLAREKNAEHGLGKLAEHSVERLTDLLRTAF